jgi:diguanylate cyclase (GGDEF)-like protein
MMVLLAIGFILLHVVLVLLVPAHAMVVSYAFLIAAPLLASAFAIRRCMIEGFASNQGWILAALSLILWTLGMVCSLRQDIFLSNSNQVPGDSMLLYILFGVPISYATAVVGVYSPSYMQRGIDAVMAISLGCLYFALMFSWITLQGSSSILSTRMVALMFDVENAFLVAATLIRFFAADMLRQRHFFGSLAGFTCLYGISAAYYNHHVAMDVAPDIGSAYDAIIDVAFLAFVLMTLREPSRIPKAINPSPALVRFVRIGSPLLLSLSVLTIALLLLRTRFNLGVAGILIAVLGYGLRSILSQVRQIETADELRSDRTALVELALRDGLTGVGNRRAFEEALEREWRVALRTQQSISLLLVDIDFFKQYNDSYGHLAGDTCIREIAAALQASLQRPADLVARYGGEEFAVILPGTSSSGAREVATRVCKLVRELNILHDSGPHGRVTVSVGASTVTPSEGVLPHELVAATDRALYDAKRNGRNRVEQVATADTTTRLT